MSIILFSVLHILYCKKLFKCFQVAGVCCLLTQIAADCHDMCPFLLEVCCTIVRCTSTMLMTRMYFTVLCLMYVCLRHLLFTSVFLPVHVYPSSLGSRDISFKAMCCACGSVSAQCVCARAVLCPTCCRYAIYRCGSVCIIYYVIRFTLCFSQSALSTLIIDMPLFE